MKINEIEINKNDPFNEDLLSRKEEIENLSEIIVNIKSPFTLSIDSPWGTGKTTLIRLWITFLENERNIKAIYFNAWENDYTDDPLIAIISSIDKYLSKNNDNNSWKIAKKIVPSLLKTSAIAATKIATLGSVELDKEYEKILSDMAGGVAEDLIESFNKKKKTILVFKELLEKSINKNKDAPLIIFIDELDRCKPSYSIELLERIKHIFNTKGVIFVLSTDMEQLSCSIKSIYGSNFNSKKYLKRFVDIEYSLKEPNIEEYINNLIPKTDFSSFFSTRGYDYSNRFKKILIFLSMCFDLKLRDINQVLSRIFLIFKSIHHNESIGVEIIAVLVVFREEENNLYKNYILDPSSAVKMIEFINKNIKKEERYSIENAMVISCLLSVNKPELANDEDVLSRLLSPYRNILGDPSSKPRVKEWARNVIEFSTKSYEYIDQKSIRRKIELLDKIQINL